MNILLLPPCNAYVLIALFKLSTLGVLPHHPPINTTPKKVKKEKERTHKTTSRDSLNTGI
jgi:hypothetical protein